jgi:hypothetical protein
MVKTAEQVAAAIVDAIQVPTMYATTKVSSLQLCGGSPTPISSLTVSGIMRLSGYRHIHSTSVTLRINLGTLAGKMDDMPISRSLFLRLS